MIRVFLKEVEQMFTLWWDVWFRYGGVEQRSDGAEQSVIDLQTGRGQCINGPEQKHTPGRMHTSDGQLLRLRSALLICPQHNLVSASSFSP